MRSAARGPKRTDPLRKLATDLLHVARKRARRAGVPFSLTADWVHARLRAGVCEETGIPFTVGGRTTRSPWSPSLDRKCPRKGYTPDNTRVVVLIHNCARGAWGDDFLNIYIKHMARRAEEVT